MQKRTREIIALVLLIVLGIGGMAALFWYMFAGHNWNEAASNIDDRVGDMGGYTVLLYEGTTPTPLEQYERPLEEPFIDESNLGILTPDDEKAGQGEPVTVGEAASSYLEKGAEVVVIDLNDLARYEDPVIVLKNNKRIALYSVSGPRADLASRKMIKRLGRYAIDCRICLVDDLEAISRGLGKVTVAICTARADAAKGGRYVGSTYAVGSPYKGQVEAVVMSSSGFLSSKTLSTL